MKSALCFLSTILLLTLNAIAQEDFQEALSRSAIKLTLEEVAYDPAYFKIPYPGGDVPKGRGVCTDVIIRAYRLQGIDLQKEVHEDMFLNFNAYPHAWGLMRTDKNIDHRRVPNLMVFFSRKGIVKKNSSAPEDYSPGDLVCWDLGEGKTHIGIVVDQKSADGARPLVIHNIGRGQVLEDCLFNFSIIGHYTYKK
jgi:uncharacterized protein YijF (DUF1287 family)